MTTKPSLRIAACLAFVALTSTAVPAAPPTVAVVPLDPDGIYQRGETVGWTITRADVEGGPLTFAVKRDNAVVVMQGPVEFAAGKATVTLSADVPAMLTLEVRSADAPRPVAVAAAAVAAAEIGSVTPRPIDFDAFWDDKLRQLAAIPTNAQLAERDAGRDDVTYATIQLDHANGTKVHGQLAVPKRPGKRPALVIFQWASPPYPLDRSWVVGPAADGWLTFNIQPHNVLPTEPKAYYDALPARLKKYESIGHDDRDKSHFVEMYLRGHRAVEYLATRDDWDGKTLVVMGTSMGGQQAIAAAALHPKVTHLIACEPAGCDLHAPLHDRLAGYPFFPVADPAVARTAAYVDAANLAPRVRATSLVAMGFVDTLTPPTGIWAAFNRLAGPKEAVPMVDAPHNHQATPQQLKPFADRSAAWLATLAKGEKVTPAPPVAPRFDDHADMMRQLGVSRLRPGPDPNDQSTFREETANGWMDTLPDALTMRDGTKVTTAAQWPARRAEIAEDFEREVYGRIPADVPAVTWEVVSTTRDVVVGVPVVTKRLVGRVDNSAYPQISVNIDASFTVPAEAKEPVPMMIAFTFGPRPTTRPGAASRPGPPPPSGPRWTEQAIAHGWGYATLVPTSIQPDNNRFTTDGIIGLTNRGRPRTPEQWGALRAWQWGASRLIDYFEANPDSKVDMKKIGIEGLSRYGKAAIVTQAFEPRVAVGLIGSSGEGGTKLHRRQFGEAVENLAGGGYYWMAGNFIKYGMDEPKLTAADLPVDSHQLIALCAPRPCFISHGVVEKGDAKWIDARGSFMAGILAEPVYELLGAKGFGTKGDFLTDPMPPVGTLVGGQLAWRQHEGGHDVTPNWPSFFEWVGQHVPSTPPAGATLAK